jgi:hypothetical protein
VTAEVDSIIAVHRASSAPGVVTDIATLGVHAQNSWHYCKIDQITKKPVTPSETPGGCAVDFGGSQGPLGTYDALRVYRAFEPYGRAGQLAELFCGQSDWCVYQGRFMLWIDVPAVVQRAIRDAHRNHIHVAVRPGTILRPPEVAPKLEVKMIVIEPVTAVSNPAGPGGWEFGRRGHVYALDGAQYFGGWQPDQAGPTNHSGRDCVGLVPTATGRGYWLVSDSGEVYAYGDAQWPGNYDLKAWGPGAITGAFRNDRISVIGGLTLVRDDGEKLNLYRLPA